ncbi:aminomethyl-transferring glycine dehydrogenase subunit GcvPA [Thiorhodovibrio frisius]|uniref:Probable glycine dehydrogenase (decarboxylating) subunit 1 n=1 Tax=Thiorhodovibrio frisius TaxID=631362 RepID=H8Z770_9GAMM|nr:aminomethyl-transferring glycine dehydrogenase subunit GcvPA [Thiorhodovibrio frisius]EIC20869.1 glycine cleavage system protein P [Thiorhodovibrio frisius]WPL21924.1 putative glycine dehydrogenase [decarboxylating] subunit 1 [Thiorhodovibrio frisius]
MPFIPHTPEDTSEMLATIGAASIEELFDEIPPELRAGDISGLAQSLMRPEPEMAVARLMQERARADGEPLCFLGAGAYEHHIPAAVWQLATRGEFYSAYTPYQAEASQGTLQVLYEFQSMMTALTGLDASNASLYDGASALAEAALMAVRANRKVKDKRVLMPASVHPFYRQTVRSIVRHQGIELVEVPYDPTGGHTTISALEQAAAGKPFAALVIPQPNVFGVLEEVDSLTDWAHQHNALVIGLVNPVALALLSPPGEWGTQSEKSGGADIACGEGQPLGMPLASGGPYLGFLCCTQALVRQLPGRIAGKTLDLDGNPGYTLTLQAREQHIRRSKATSNICTNQGLLVTAATIHLSLLGAEGLERVAAACHANTRALIARLCEIPGIEPVFDRPVFHEQLLRLPRPTEDILKALAAENILAGFNLGRSYPELDGSLLVCATETRTESDIDRFRDALGRALS